jgi:membrane protease YdiL (CAAX protease family)
MVGVPFFFRVFADNQMNDAILMISQWIGGVAVAMIAGLSPKFHHTKLVFVYPRRDGIVALGIFAFSLLVAVIVSSLPVFSLIGLANFESRRLAIAGLSLVSVGVALWRRKQPVRSTGWGRDKLTGSLQLGLALAFLSIFLRGKFSAVVNGLSGPELGLLAFSLVVVLVEETIFRGYIQLRLMAWWGEIPGWLVSALMFTAVQLPRLMLEPETLLPNLLVVAGQSLVAGFIMLRSGHTLAPALFRAVSEWLVFVQ